jgi:glycosyltransferase involved in cell wall biosynthesis
MEKSKKVCMAFLGNPLHDSRITNLTNSLRYDGYRVLCVGFDWFISPRDFKNENFIVFKLTKHKIRLLFYLKFVFILIRELLKTNSGLYIAEDFYTLPFVAIIGKIKNAKIYYNSRELYAFLGGLRNRPYLQKLVKAIEQYFIKKVDLVLTTGEMDSEFLEKFYGINNTLVIRNIPLLQKPENKIDFRKEYGIAPDKLILLYQGVLLEGRGIPLILKALRYVENTVLLILGDGEQKNNFQKLAFELGVSDRIIFAGTIDQKNLINYTAGADIGLSLIENISISYYHALPNKLFEYIMAGLPVLSSDLPQMKKIIDTYEVGEAIDISKEQIIVDTLKKWESDPKLIQKYKVNCGKAALELNWQAEYQRAKNKLLNF